MTPDGTVFIDRVEIVFDAGHRILGHQGKCSSPHGHTYRAEVFVRADELDQLGFAMDFGNLKAPLKAWIDSHWDHAFLVNAVDDQLRHALGQVDDAKVFVLERGNPSAEMLAAELFDVAHKLFGLSVQSVRIWESPNQYSEFAPGAADWSPQLGNDTLIRRSNL
jgi:6-pyruvoyltetrahydropterin/6-carboxytetrahydropterin synthase